MDYLPQNLIIAYSFWYYFLGHQMSHVVYAKQGLVQSPTFLPLFAVIARALGIVFLIYFGFKSHWYLALLLYGIGLIGQFIIVRIETSIDLQKRALFISLAGVPILPIVLVYMFYMAANIQTH